MTLTIGLETPPLRVDEAGAIRVGNTRVLFVLVVRAYQTGESPERITRIYETLDLADVYAVIAYYLRHRPEVDRFLEEYDKRAEEVRREIEQRQGSQVGMRERLRSRLSAEQLEEIRRLSNGNDLSSADTDSNN